MRRTLPTYTIIKPDKPENHISRVIDALIGYHGESWQGRKVRLSWDKIASKAALILTQPHCVLAYDGERLAGFAMATTAESWHGLEVDIDMFYVRPQDRGKGAGRAVLAAILDSVAAENPIFIYAGAQSGISSQVTRTYVNLFLKFGFEEVGQILAKYTGGN